MVKVETIIINIRNVEIIIMRIDLASALSLAESKGETKQEEELKKE